MRRGTVIVLTLVAGMVSATVAHAAETRISFGSPENFTDIDTDGSSLTVETTLDRLRRILTDLGRRLPNDQLFDIEVADVDLAGRVLPPRSGMSTRAS